MSRRTRVCGAIKPSVVSPGEHWVARNLAAPGTEVYGPHIRNETALLGRLGSEENGGVGPLAWSNTAKRNGLHRAEYRFPFCPIPPHEMVNSAKFLRWFPLKIAQKSNNCEAFRAFNQLRAIGARTARSLAGAPGNEKSSRRAPVSLK